MKDRLTKFVIIVLLGGLYPEVFCDKFLRAICYEKIVAFRIFTIFIHIYNVSLTHIWIWCLCGKPNTFILSHYNLVWQCGKNLCPFMCVWFLRADCGSCKRIQKFKNSTDILG